MILFRASSNSRYFAYQKEKEIALYRDEGRQWRKELPFQRIYLLGVGNAGDSAVLGDDGIYIYHLNPDEKPDFIQRYSREVLKKNSSYLGKIEYDGESNRFCIESITPKRSGMGRLLGIPSSPDKSVMEEHNINILELQSKRHRNFYKFMLSRNQERKVLWDISRAFNFFIYGEPVSKGAQQSTKFHLVNVSSEEVYQEFELKTHLISHLEVNDAGMALVEYVEGGEKKLLAFSQDGGQFPITLAGDYSILHVGRGLVAAKTRPAPSFIVKSFQDNIICRADLQALDELEITYQILFDVKDHINFVFLLGGELRVTKTEVDLFISEAKRWERLALEKRQKPREEEQRQVEEEDKKRQKAETTQKKRDELGQGLIRAADERKPEQAPVPKEVDERKPEQAPVPEEFDETPEELKLQFILGAIDDDEYARKKEMLKNAQLSEQVGAEKKGLSKRDPLSKGGDIPREAPREIVAAGKMTPKADAPPASTKRIPDSLPIGKKVPKSLDLGVKKNLEVPASLDLGVTKKLEASTREEIEKAVEGLNECFIMGNISEDEYRAQKKQYIERLRGL